MTRQSWFRMAAKADAAEIFIFDEIGFFGMTAADFIAELKKLGAVKSLTVRINSLGGVPFDAVAIHNVLKRHPAKVTVRVEGVAASAASVIAMAGDPVIMPDNTLMMIHEARSAVFGDAEGLRKEAEVVESVNEAIANIYATKSGLKLSEVREVMAEEEWLTASEAVELGFADRIEAPIAIAAAIDLSRFKNPPVQVLAPRRQPVNPRAAVPRPMSAEEDAERERAAAICELCCEAGESDVMADWINMRLTVDDVKAELARRSGIKAAVREAQQRNIHIGFNLADEFIAAGLLPEQVRAKLRDKYGEAPRPVKSAASAAGAADPHGWDRAVAKINSQSRCR